jgi:hypothetical protein
VRGLRRLILILVVLAVTVAALPTAVWELGVELPARRIDSGVEDFEGVEKEMAQAALAKVYLRTRETASFMVDRRVERVWWCPGVDSEKERRRALWALGGFGAEVRPYTLFGIPEGKITLACKGDRFRWEFF